METEHFFTYPYFRQTISMISNLSIEEQTCVKDCEVCCHPIQSGYATEIFEPKDFRADGLEE